MPPASDSLAFLYIQAWCGLGIILAYYLVLFVVFRARKTPRIGVIQYEPPKGISPAVAATLRENGLCERAFASALVSLSVKRFLAIHQNKDRFIFKKLREPDDPLPPEESILLSTLFPGGLNTYEFDSIEYSRLCSAFMEFKEVLEGIVEPELISAHSPLWWVGIACSLMPIIPLAGSIVSIESISSLASLAYLGIWVLLGGSCLVAALHVWPATFRKLTSYFPWDDRPSRPLDPTDAIPVLLSASALCGFIFLAVLTSTEFAVLLGCLVLVNTVFRHSLESPTRAGRKVLDDLENFREFLARTGTDRLNRENQPGHSPLTFEKHTAFAVALDVEHTWGEEFVENLMSLFQLDEAYHRRPSTHALDYGPPELKIPRRR